MGKKKKNPFEVDRYVAANGREATAGKESTAELSIDGKSFNYRDPRNLDGLGRGVETSRHAYEYTNPLYDYSYGQVRDAAKALDIGNVNSQDEVDQLLKQIRGGSKPKAENFKDDYIDKKIAPRENSDTEVEIPSATSGDATAGDNSIASPISQVSGIDIAGDRNSVDQNNSIDQDQAGSFLDKYKLNLRDNGFGS